MLKLLRTRPTYTSCDDLPLANFIKIVCTGELVHLYSEPAKYIHRNAPLAEIWERIFNEYNELTNNTQSKHVFNLIKEITVITGRLEIIQNAVDVLAKYGSKDFQGLCQMLREMVQVNYTYEDKNLEKELKSTVTRAKILIVQLNQSKSEYELLAADDGKKATVNDYYDLVSVLSKFQGHQIPLHTTTVSLYISYLNQFRIANSKENGK